MADEHRRIEPRMPVAGTGMASDPERIEALQDAYDRRVRASNPREGPSFGAVLKDAPAFDPDEDESASATEPDPSDSEDDKASTSDADDTSAEAEPSSKLPRIAPDPRMQALHAMVAPVPAPVANAPAPVATAPKASDKPKRRAATKTSSNTAPAPKPSPKRLGRRGGRAPT